MTNARLKNVFSLSSKVTVYVPATININKEIDNKEFVDRAATLLSDCFGGATSTDALGYWTSPTAGLVKERTTMVFAYASEKDLRNKLDQVIDLCEDLKKEMTQDAIALEVNGEMFFIQQKQTIINNDFMQALEQVNAGKLQALYISDKMKENIDLLRESGYFDS